MLFGAVHYLLLGGIDHPLHRFYSTVGGEAPPEESYPDFRAFVLEHQAEIVPILKERAVQTNEVARSSILLPGYDHVAQESGRGLAIVELGTSAGLNLVFDRYHYSYDPGPAVGDPTSAVNLECIVEGQALPNIDIPNVGWRLGIDLNPVDVTHEPDARWLQALVWPDQPARFHRLEAAISEFNSDPPRLLTGGLDVLQETIADAPTDLALCVSHSFMRSQLDKATRDRFHDILLAADRTVHRVSFEPAADRASWLLECTTYAQGLSASRRLAEAHYHGAWIRWLGAAARAI